MKTNVTQQGGFPTIGKIMSGFAIILILSNSVFVNGQQPNSCNGVEQMAYRLWEKENYREAIQYFLQAEKCSNNTQISFFLARCYMSLGEYRKAIDAFNRFDASNPLYFWSFGNQAICYNKLGLTDSAQVNFEKAIVQYENFKANGKTSPDGYRLYAFFGSFNWQQGRKQIAEAQFGRSLKDYAEDPEIYLDLAEFLIAEQKFEACDSIFHTVKSLNPQKANRILLLYYQFCNNLLAKRSIKESEAALKEGLEHPYKLEWSFELFNREMQTSWVSNENRRQIAYYQNLIVSRSGMKIATNPTKRRFIDKPLSGPKLAIQLTASPADMGGFIPNGMQIFDHRGEYQFNFLDQQADTSCSSRIQLFTHIDGIITIWDAATGSEIRRLFNVGRVLRIATAAMGNRIATADINGNVRVWSVETGEILASFKSCQPQIALSADGASIVVFRDPDHRIRDHNPLTPSGVYNVDTKQLLCSLNPVNEYLNHVTFSPDGKKVLMVIGSRLAQIVDVEETQTVLSLVVRGANSGSFSNDSKKVVLLGDSITVVDGENWARGNDFTQTTMTIPSTGTLKDSDVKTNSVYWANDNLSLLAIMGDVIREWNTSTGHLITTYTQKNSASGAAPDNNELLSLAYCSERNLLFASRKDGTLLEWSKGIAEVKRKVQLHISDKSWWTVMPGARGKLLVLSGLDKKLPYIFDFDQSKLTSLPRSQVAEAIDRAIFSNDGSFILSQTKKRITIWDIKNTGRPVANYDGSPSDFLVSTNGTIIIDGNGVCLRAINKSIVSKINLPKNLVAHTFSKNDSLIMILAADGLASLIRLKDGEVIQTYDVGRQSTEKLTSSSLGMAVSPDFELLGILSGDTIYTFSINGQFMRKFGVRRQKYNNVNLLKYLEGCHCFVTGYDDGQLISWPKDSSLGQNFSNNVEKDLLTLEEDITKIIELRKQRKLIILSRNGKIKSFSLEKTDYPDIQFDHEAPDLQLAFSGASYVVWIGSVLDCDLSHDKRMLATAGADGTIRLWECATADKKMTLNNSSPTRTISFSYDDHYLISSCDDGSVHIWDITNKKELCKLVYYSEDEWAVFTDDGSFDTGNPEKITGLNWIFPDAPFTPTSPLILTRDYYKYRLLSRTFSKNIKDKIETGSLVKINRVQPLIEAINVSQEPGAGPEWVNVTVRVSIGNYECKSSPEKPAKGVYDVRLFRDGQLVGEFPRHTADYLIQSSGNLLTEKIAWRTNALVPCDSSTNVVFRHIRLPRNKTNKNVRFSAYSFNDDRVKSETLSIDYNPPKGLEEESTRAIILSMGVSRVENGLNLATAAKDARAISGALSNVFIHRYSQVIPIQLISSNGSLGKNEVPPSKENLSYILSSLSGKRLPTENISVPESLMRTLQNIGPLRPGDALIFFFSGHGFAAAAGTFYLIPENTGPCYGMRPEDVTAYLDGKATTEQKELAQPFVKTCINSAEIALLLKDIDASLLTLIFDCCYSGAVVGNNAVFRPGPMGDPGLGQLLYDKGATILTASNDQEQSIGNLNVSNGLLTSALLAPKNVSFLTEYFLIPSWLERASRDVPLLFQEYYPSKDKQSNQNPEFFYFKKEE